MAHLDALSYKGKQAVVNGAATGMGAAAVELLKELGATIVALDIAPISAEGVTAIQCDLNDRASIDAAVNQISGEVHALFCCAGVPGNVMTPFKAFTINYTGHIYMIESLLPKMPQGSSITSISSGAGMGYLADMERLMPLVNSSGFEEAAAWFEADGHNEGYSTPKAALNLYTTVKAKEFGEHYRIRINATSPGVTESQLLPAFAEAGGGTEHLKKNSGSLGRFAQPIEQAWAIVFLGSDAASFINGAVLNVDAGLAAQVFTGQLKFGLPEE